VHGHLVITLLKNVLTYMHYTTYTHTNTHSLTFQRSYTLRNVKNFLMHKNELSHTPDATVMQYNGTVINNLLLKSGILASHADTQLITLTDNQHSSLTSHQKKKRLQATLPMAQNTTYGSTVILKDSQYLLTYLLHGAESFLRS